MTGAGHDQTKVRAAAEFQVFRSAGVVVEALLVLRARTTCGNAQRRASRKRRCFQTTRIRVGRRSAGLQRAASAIIVDGSYRTACTTNNVDELCVGLRFLHQYFHFPMPSPVKPSLFLPCLAWLGLAWFAWPCLAWSVRAKPGLAKLGQA